MKFQKKPWKSDPRSKNFSHTRFFGSVSVASLPESLNRPRKTPENQKETQRCAAYAGAMNGQYIHGIRMSPEWQTKQIGKLQGQRVDIDGSEPNAAMKSQTYSSGGYLPYTDSPVTLEKDGVDATATPQNYPAELDMEAQNYGDKGFVKPDGEADMFDSIRVALFMAYDPATKKGACVQAFSEWHDSFGRINIITLGKSQGYHSYLFVDWTIVNGVAVLVLQNSYGTAMGDLGYQYMSRSVVNSLFNRPYTTIKIPKTLTKEQIELAKQETPFGRIQRAIIDIWFYISVTFFYGA